MRFAPSTKSRKRSLGPVDGPSGSYEVPSAGPAGPVWPEWLKYGPIDRITGVLSASEEPLGRRTSACRVASPALVGDEIQASLQSASGYATPDADASDGATANEAIAMATASPNRTDMRHPLPPSSVGASPRRTRQSTPPARHERRSQHGRPPEPTTASAYY